MTNGPWPRRRPLPGRAAVTAAVLAASLAAASASGETTLGTGQLRLVGSSFDVEPVTQTVPVGVPAVLRTVFGGDAAGLAQAGLRVSAELSGPGLAAPVTLTTAPGADLRLPPLQLKGEYRLQAIRLTDGAGATVPAVHPTATVVVTDVLISSISSRVLTPAELADRGVVVDDRSFRGFSFSLGLAIQGRTISVELPPMVWTGTEYQAVGPPRVEVERPLESFQLPTVVAVPLRDDTGAAPPYERDELDEDAVAPTPVFGLLVFPGNVRFLNQFLSVVLVVQNGSPTGSGLALTGVSTTVSLPASGLRLAGTTPPVADGQSIPVRHPGPDGVLGTPDDLVVLAAQQAGSAEMVAEGLKVGTHEVVCELEATLDGLAGQPPRRLTGRARGSVVVRDPSFALTFHHPEVVRKDEEYELRVSVANTSTVRANQVSLSIDAGSLTGAVPVDTPPGVDPVAALGDILPADASEARFLLRATRTGRVVASAFTSDGAVSGSLRLRTGVTNDGTPLSPDTFVFPPFVSVLPGPFVDAATRLIGIAHGLATSDATVSGSLPPAGCSDAAVRERATELVAAARRVRIGQPVASAVTDVFLRWLGSRDEIPGFDLVRRRGTRGRELETATAETLELFLQSAGRPELEQLLLDAAAANGEPPSTGRAPAGPVFVLLETGDSAHPPARLRLSDPQSAAETSGGPGEDTALRELPYASLLPLVAPEGGQMGLVGRLPESGVDVVIEGRQVGSVNLLVLYPDDRGGFSRVRFGGVPVREGSLATIRIGVGAEYLVLASSIDSPKVVSPSPAAPTPFSAVAAVQDVDANPLGKVVTLLFNRSVDAGATVAPRLWRLPTTTRQGTATERSVLAVSASSDPRLVSVVSAVVISPVRPGRVSGELVPGSAGESWSGELPVVPRLDLEGGEVEGRVLGPDGAPLANVDVRLSEAATDDLSGRSFEATTATSRTDGQGAFTFDFVRRQDGRPFRVDAIDPATGSKGWAAGSIRRDGELVHVDVALLGRGSVRGVVVDGAGARVPGAIVRCSSAVDSYRSSLYSAADGSFAFASVPIGTLQLQAEEPRTRETTWASTRLEAPGASTEMTLVLSARPRARLSGRVVTGDGLAVVGAWVAGYGETGEYFGARQTPEGGAFLFESAPAGAVRLEVFDGQSRSPALVQGLTLQPDGVHDVTLVLAAVTPRYGAGAGVVRRLLGGVASAVAGAPVWVTDSGARTTSGADGSYRLDDVPVGQTSVWALLPSSGRAVSTSATVLEGVTTTADLLFSDTSLGTVRGTVVDQAGQPRANALVEIWDEGPPLALVAGSRSGGDGAFLLERVPPGSWRIQATAAETRDGVALRNAGSATVTLPGPGASATATLALRGFVDVSGRVVARVRDRNGELVESPAYCTVEVAAGSFSGDLPGDPATGDDPERGRVFGDGPGPAGSAKTDPSTGAFRFRHVHGGPIRIVAKNPFYGERGVDLGFVKGDAARGPVDIVFDGNLGVVDGFLLDPSGAPLPAARVTLMPLGSSFGDPIEATTAADGSFLFPLVPFSQAGHLVYSGSLEGVDRWAEARVSVTAESPRARATLRVVPVGNVAVHVTTAAAGAPVPVPGAQVRIEETEGPRRALAGTTDGEGVARFTGVSAVPLGIVARMGLVSGRSAALGVGEGFRVETVVSLAEAAEVSGVVRHPSDGTGLEGVNVLLDAGPWKGILGAATTGAQGRFRIPEVPGGDGTVFRIRAEDPRTLRGGSSEAFDLAAGESRNVDVTIRAIGSVTGVVRTFDGSRPLAGAEVDVTSSDEAGNGSPSLRISTATDGTYRTDGVPEGTVLVRARDGVSGLSASASGHLAGEGEVLVLDLSATATGHVRGSVLTGSGVPLPPEALAPEVRLEAGTTREARLSAAYDFAEVDATAGFLLRALERVEPFHAGLLRGRAVAGQVVVANVRYSPFGTLRVRTVKPDPDRHGSFLPAAGDVVLWCGEPYVYRFPCGAPVRTDESGNLTLANVGVGAGGRLDAGEAGTGARGSSEVAPFTATGETRDVTVVLEPRGIVRGRFLSGSAGAPEPAVSVVLEHRDVRGRWRAVGSAVSGADGRFEARDVPLAGLVLRAVTTAGPLARSEVPVSLSAVAPVFDAGDLLLDAERPALVRVSPPDGTSGVGLLPVFEAVFSEPLGAALFWREPREFVELTGPFGGVPATVTLEPGETTLRITIPEYAPLAGAAPYQLRILGSLPDRSGLVLGGDVVVRFTTADLTAPTVLTSAPLPGQIQVGTDVNPVVVFTKAIDPATLTPGVRLERLDAPQGVAACTPALRADGRTVALNPAQALEAEAEYAIVVDGVADAAGNRLPSVVRIPFLTRDDRPPVVTLDAPSNATPLEGSLQTYTVRFAGDDVARVRLVVVAATGSSTCGEKQPGPSASEAAFSCRLPRISSAGGTGLVLRAEAVDRSGNDALGAERVLTLSPDAPPVLSVTSPADGTHLLSGTVVAVVGNVEEDNGSVTVTARLGGTSRTASGPGSFVLALPVPIVAAASSVTLDVSAVDAAGNVARPVAIVLGVDPDVEPPTLSISSPDAGGSLIGGRALPFVASAADDAGVVSVRWRAGGGAWSTPAAGAISVYVPTPAVAAETPFLLELEARDGAGNVTTGSRGVRLLPNLVPDLRLTSPGPGFRVTALGTFVVEGTAADDGGLPTISATYRGTTRTATGTSFSFTFAAPAVSTPTETSVEVVAADAEGNVSAPLAVPVTVVPDAGGTPTIVLTSPVPALLLAGEGASVALTYADNVGLEAGTVEVTGGLSSGGRLGFALAGTTAEKVVPLNLAAVPFGAPARVVATLRNVSARTASLDVALPVAFHRLESPLPTGVVAEGSALAASFRITPEGRARAVALRLEIGTRTAGGFSTFACTQRSAPLAEVEVLSVVVPAGRTNLSVRSILVGTDGSEAVAADVDGRTLFERALATTADAAPPTVAITAPTAAESFPAGVRVTVDVTAADDVRLRSIEATFAGVTKACLSSPCRVSFFAPQVAAATSVPITTVAKDVSGRSATASVVVTVTPQGGSSTGATAVRGDGREPRVSFVTPVLSPAAVAPGSTYVPWVDASDEDGIDTIELFLGDDATEPCLVLRMPQDAWPPRKGCAIPDLPEGTEKALIARATDRSGESAEARAVVVVRAGLRVAGPTALVVAGDELARERLYVEGDVEIAGDLRVGELHLRAGSTLRPSPRGATPDTVRVFAEGDAVLDAGSRIDVSGTGTRRLSELDALAFPDREGDGAPHGGDAGFEPSLRRAYGSFSAPVLPGARGGTAGTFGGGVVVLSARRIGLAGVVAADGEPGNADRPSWRGLGSGGSIFLVAEESISGPVDVEGGRWGLLSARGAVPSQAEAAPSRGALAAGGRIALSAARLSFPLFDVFGTQPGGSFAGQPGTIFVRDALSPDGTLLVPVPGSPGATSPGEAP